MDSRKIYDEQVSLLIRILPLIAKEVCFGLKAELRGEGWIQTAFVWLHASIFICMGNASLKDFRS